MLSKDELEELKGGVVASREGSENYGKENYLSFGKKGAPIYVKYRDLVLFKNCSPDEMDLDIRETMGWLIEEDSETVLICFDRSAGLLPNEQISAAGLVIPKDCILEKHTVRIKKPFNHSCRDYSGLKRPYTKGK